MHHQEVVNDLEFHLVLGLVCNDMVVLVSELRVKLKDVNFTLIRVSVKENNFIVDS